MGKTGKIKRSRPRRRRQRGGKFDFQKAIEKTGIEFHLPGYKKKSSRKSRKPRENSNCNLRVFFYFNKQTVCTQCLCLVLTFSIMSLDHTLTVGLKVDQGLRELKKTTPSRHVPAFSHLRKSAALKKPFFHPSD